MLTTKKINKLGFLDSWTLGKFYFALLLTETKSNELGQQKNYYMAKKRTFSCGTNAGNPERAR